MPSNAIWWSHRIRTPKHTTPNRDKHRSTAYARKKEICKNFVPDKIIWYLMSMIENGFFALFYILIKIIFFYAKISNLSSSLLIICNNSNNNNAPNWELFSVCDAVSMLLESVCANSCLTYAVQCHHENAHFVPVNSHSFCPIKLSEVLFQWNSLCRKWRESAQNTIFHSSVTSPFKRKVRKLPNVRSSCAWLTEKSMQTSIFSMLLSWRLQFIWTASSWWLPVHI